MWVFLIAQAGASDPANWITGLGSVSSVGIACWFLYYTKTVSEPKQREDTQALADKFMKALESERLICKEERQELLNELRAERQARKEMEASRHADNQAITACINRLSEQLHVLFELTPNNGNPPQYRPRIGGDK